MIFDLFCVLIVVFVQVFVVCYCDGSCLLVVVWIEVVCDEVEVYVVQDGVVVVLGWWLECWKFGGVGLNGFFSYFFVDMVLGQVLLGVEVEVVLCVVCDIMLVGVQGLFDGVVDVMCIVIEGVVLCWVEGLDVLVLFCMVDFQFNVGLLLGEWLFYCVFDWVQLCWQLILFGQFEIVG